MKKSIFHTMTCLTLNSLTRSLIYDFAIETNKDILVDKQTIQL